MVPPKTYLFFGNVGAGKGTQIFLLKDLLERRDNARVAYVGLGDEMRKFVGGEGYSSLLGKEILNRGELMPLFIVAQGFANAIVSGLQGFDDHLLIDGFPRSVEQVAPFESAMKFYSRQNVEIIYLDISKEAAVERLRARGRHDDTEEGIIQRFKEYENNVLPALELLKEKGYKVHHISGEQHIDNVHANIRQVLEL